MKQFEMLQNKGIKFEKGLSHEELEQIEQLYAIEFPQELKEAYMTALPVSEGFYKWREFSDSNVNHIKELIQKPFEDIVKAIDDVEWCDSWGIEPTENEKTKIIEEKLKLAPKLIPIYYHRYVVSGRMDKSPVLSVHGTDIIYYGENLEQYLEIEFKEIPYSEMDYKKIAKIPFWSEIM